MSRQCYLKCLQSAHDLITLPHNVEIFIGRSKITKIRDQSCSRQQISLKANCEECYVEIKRLGVNPSGFDGFAMLLNKTYKISHGTKIEVLLGLYHHLIEFNPPPDAVKLGAPIKRKLEDDDSVNEIRKTPKMDISQMTVNECSSNIWECIDNGKLYIFTSKGVKPSNKIAAFDMDGTLISTKSGKVYPINVDDWKIAFGNAQRKLKQQLEKGFKIVIMTNQSPIGKGKVKIEDFKTKIEKVVEKLEVPIQVYIATNKDLYRKPCTGMWKILTEKKNDSVKVDIAESFYCGDAAGRVANWAPGKKKDHSTADKLLAKNLNLKFLTPEEFFLGHSIGNSSFGKLEFHPKDVTAQPFNEKLINKKKEVLVLVGFPGSGKSFLAKQIQIKSNQQYITVCRDKLGSWQKCASEASKYLQQGKSIIVDCTNPNIESRERWVSLAKSNNVECRCVKMTTTFTHAQHNNKYRELMKFDHVPVSDMIFHSYKNKFVEPSIAEGFTEIIQEKINPQFEDEEAEKLYRMYLLEK